MFSKEENEIYATITLWNIHLFYLFNTIKCIGSYPAVCKQKALVVANLCFPFLQLQFLISGKLLSMVAVAAMWVSVLQWDGAEIILPASSISVRVSSDPVSYMSSLLDPTHNLAYKLYYLSGLWNLKSINGLNLYEQNGEYTHHHRRRSANCCINLTDMLVIVIWDVEKNKLTKEFWSEACLNRNTHIITISSIFVYRAKLHNIELEVMYMHIIALFMDKSINI